MRATSFLLGCLLSLGVVATAVAHGESSTASANASANSNCNGNVSSAEHGSSHDAATPSGGDAPGAVHGGSGSSANRHTDPTPSTESDVPRFGDDSSPNHSSHGSGLSWQSLLPGSIQ